MKLTGLRILSRQVQGKPTTTDASIGKLHNCNLLVAMQETAMELLGSESNYLAGSEAAVNNGRWQVGALGWPTTVIGGGTANIQKNIIAERMLGAPQGLSPQSGRATLRALFAMLDRRIL